MCNDLHNFGNKCFVGRDLGIPGLYVVPYNDGDESIQLKIHVVPTSQGRQ